MDTQLHSLSFPLIACLQAPYCLAPPPHPPIPYTLKVSNRILARLHPGSHIPILDQTRPDHAPDACNVALAERDAVASEVDGAKGRAGQVGADEDALEVDGAAFELGGLEGDHDGDAALLGWVSAVMFSLLRRIRKLRPGSMEQKTWAVGRDG